MHAPRMHRVSPVACAPTRTAAGCGRQEHQCPFPWLAGARSVIVSVTVFACPSGSVAATTACSLSECLVRSRPTPSPESCTRTVSLCPPARLNDARPITAGTSLCLPWEALAATAVFSVIVPVHACLPVGQLSFTATTPCALAADANLGLTSVGLVLY